MNLKNKQRAFADKHYMARWNNKFLNDRWLEPKKGNRFKIRRFRKVVYEIKRHLKNPFLSDPSFLMTKGVTYNGGTKTFHIRHSHN